MEDFSTSEERSRALDPDKRVVTVRAYVRQTSRRGLEVALGVAWLVDGLLQLQPYMFGKEFFANVLGMASMGLPPWIGAMPNKVLELLYPSHVVFNALFAAVQLVIGVGLLWRRSARFALIGSFAWALTVWFGGEGFGGLFMPGRSTLTGAPGAVIVYLALSVILWPTRKGDGRSLAAASVLGERGVLGFGRYSGLERRSLSCSWPTTLPMDLPLNFATRLMASLAHWLRWTGFSPTREASTARLSR
jgi:hypothetical protein